VSGEVNRKLLARNTTAVQLLTIYTDLHDQNAEHYRRTDDNIKPIADQTA